MEPLTCIGGVPYGQAGDVPLLLDIIAPPASAKLRPAVIWVHGGSWIESGRADGHNALFCPLLAQHGFFTMTIDYRLMPAARFPAQIHDVKAAIRWLRAHAHAYAILILSGSAFGASPLADIWQPLPR